MRSRNLFVSSIAAAVAVAVCFLLPLSAGANPVLEGAIESVTQANNACDVEIEMVSQMYNFTLFLYRSQTLNGSGEVANTPENLVGSVSGSDAYSTYTYWDSLSGIWITNYYYQLTDISRTSGTWYYQLYCDYGNPGTEYPLFWPHEIALTDCDCDDFSLHNPLTHQGNYNSLSYYSGAAVMSMIINSLNGSSPAPAQTSFIPQPTTTGYTAAQVEAILEVHPEIASTTSWGHVQDADRDYVLFQIAYWQNQNGIGAAVPTNGDYLHWVAIEGAESVICPLGSDPNTYGLIGFWVDDPADGKTYKTAAEWNSSYYDPTSGAEFEAVVEPPEEQGSVIIEEAASRPMVCPAPKSTLKRANPTRSISEIYATLRTLDADDPAAAPQIFALKQAAQCIDNLVQQYAVEGIAEFGLTSDPTFAAAYNNTSPHAPTFVDRTDSGGHDYYLVPFVRSVIPDPIPDPEDDITRASVPLEQVKAVVRVDAVTGQFLEVKYTVSGSLSVPAPDGSYYWHKSFPETPFHPRTYAPCVEDICQTEN